MKYDYICIEGVIGAGKTSLAKHLAKEHRAKLILEQFEDNPFLPKFYREPGKYAFPLELSFLASRFQQLKEKLSSGDLFHPLVVSDYFIQKSLIFARKTLEGDELNLYIRLFNIMGDILPRPGLLVFLHLSIDRLMENIKLRGRDYEKHITHEYLSQIQEGYFDWIRQHPEQRILILDTNRVDFVHNEEDYQKIRDIVDQEHPTGIQRISIS